ncbi:hypothetical protein UFOVP1247_320 [uncultured Caudovirales phage]|uniref:Uncharacterized protein n=1 Tax=uncultured Caudovirales phage TaxID=2100421 RepID=A0A6J5RAE8_9CAUD|nr:hypothetical protein UFOVP970_7 [uncultured Caudovirales phage]CAB4193949.1 hypothetical protein UFOVP1247_320 [uncultured Caudovirales phage]
MIHWIKQNKESIIRIAFLIPILSVAIISISHVVSWYNLANPLSWAIYLSVAIEVAALSSIAAASVKVKGFSVWFVFIIVTLIQFIGNIYFSYTEININSKEFKDWAELTLPLFESFSDTTDLVSQRRLLAILEGGLLPLISLTCLHFFIKYGDRDSQESEPIVSGKIVEPTKSDESKRVWEKVKELREEGKLPIPTEEDLADEPTALANSQYRNEEPMIEDNVIFIDESPIIESPKDPIERKEVTGGVSLTKGPMSSNNKLRRQ